MTIELHERTKLFEAIKRIPCELSTATYDEKRDGSPWIGCKECARCLLLRAIGFEGDPLKFIEERVLPLPINGGYGLRSDLRL